MLCSDPLNSFILPNENLKPEYSYNGELGISKTFDGYIQINTNFFITYLTNAIVRTEYSLPDIGDSLLYDNDNYRIITNSNAEEALIRGISLSVLSDLNSNLSFRSTLNYIHGKILTDSVPMAHIPPIFGKTTISYKIKNFNNELYLIGSIDKEEDIIRYDMGNKKTLKDRVVKLNHRIDALRVYKICIDDSNKLKMEPLSKDTLNVLVDSE